MRRLQELEDEFPDLRTPSSPTQRVARHLLDAVHRRRSPRAHAQPRQRVLASRRCAAWAQRVERDAGDGAGLPVRAEGRRPRGQPRLRGRPAGARRHPRRRAHRRGRHAQRPHHRERARPADRRRRAARARGARRGVLPGRAASRRSTRRSSRPARRRSRTRATPPPVRCGRRTRGSPRAARLRMVVHGVGRVEGGPKVVSAVRLVRRAARAGGCRPPPGRGRAGPRGGAGVHRLLRRAPARRSSTRSTASWSRSTTWRCSGGSARPAARRAGRSRSSTRPKRSTPSCSTSGSTSGAPAGSRRSG